MNGEATILINDREAWALMECIEAAYGESLGPDRVLFDRVIPNLKKLLPKGKEGSFDYIKKSHC